MTSESNLFNSLFRHSEKVRILNHVQEKMLQETIKGNKGYEHDLHKQLTKIEKDSQILREELYYMGKEMQTLGIQKPEKDENKQPIIKDTDSLSAKPISSRKFSIKSPKFEKHYSYRETVKTGNDTMPSIRIESESARRSVDLGGRNSIVSHEMRIKRANRKALSLPTSDSLPTKLTRKHSLGNHSLLGYHPTAASRLNFLSDHPSTSTDESIFGDSSTEISSNTRDSICSEQLYSPKLLQLPKLYQIPERKKSRKGSFTKVDFYELDIPKVYTHSNEALNRYKFNPNYFLPDGTLKRKFSLPQLKDSLEALKYSQYLRRSSVPVDNSETLNESDEIDCIDYIFNDTDIQTINKNTLA